MLKFLTALILVLFYTSPVFAQPKAPGFFGIPWNSSRERVSKEFGAVPNKDGELVARFNQGGQISTLIFSFESNKLVRVVTMSESPASSPEGTALFCDIVASNVSREYGRPKVLTDSDVGPVLEWNGEDTQVQMGCRFDPPGLAIIIWKPLEQPEVPKGIAL